MQRHELYKRSRSCEITSLSFGPDRKEEFPEHFFCDGCDKLENAVVQAAKATRGSGDGRSHGFGSPDNSEETIPTQSSSPSIIPKP